jgi:uncharacterized protein YodC (DUF2158 family)
MILLWIIAMIVVIAAVYLVLANPPVTRFQTGDVVMLEDSDQEFVVHCMSDDGQSVSTRWFDGPVPVRVSGPTGDFRLVRRAGSGS